MSQLFLSVAAHTFSPTDNFFERSHRLIATCMLFFTPGMIALAVPFLYLGIEHDMDTIALWVGVSTSLFGIVICCFPYLWMRLFVTWSENQMDIWLLVFNVNQTLLLNSFKSSAFIGMYYFAGFIIVTSQTQKMKYHVGLALVGVFIFKYNMNTLDSVCQSTNEINGLRFPGAQELPAWAQHAVIVTFALMWGLMLLGTHSIVSEYRRQMLKAQNTAMLCYDVAEKLLRYDTDEARQMLEGSEDVDKDLKGALIRMVLNLESFRPHLPEYVWRMAMTSSTTPNSSLDDANTNSSDYSVQMDDFLAKQQSSFDIVQTLPPQMPNTSISLSHLGPVQTNYASYALIDFRKKTSGQDLKLNNLTTIAPMKVSAVRNLVNWCHSHAMKSNGSLHSFLGDTIHVTWIFHAASAKPALFLARLYRTFTNHDDSGLFVSGALGTGPGITYMAGDRRQANILHMQWKESVWKIFQYARDNCAALLNEEAFKGCATVIQCRWVNIMKCVVGCTEEESVRVYEFLREKVKGHMDCYDVEGGDMRKTSLEIEPLVLDVKPSTCTEYDASLTLTDQVSEAVLEYERSNLKGALTILTSRSTTTSPVIPSLSLLERHLAASEEEDVKYSRTVLSLISQITAEHRRREQFVNVTTN